MSIKNKSIIQTSHAILLLGNKYIMQLRDKKPHISAPGVWSLFGGRLETNEKQIDGVKREIFEELKIIPSEFKYLWYEDYYDPFWKTTVRTWFFEALVDDVWDKHKLNEGTDVKAFNYKELAVENISAIIRKAIKRHYMECVNKVK